MAFEPNACLVIDKLHAAIKVRQRIVKLISGTLFFFTLMMLTAFIEQDSGVANHVDNYSSSTSFNFQ